MLTAGPVREIEPGRFAVEVRAPVCLLWLDAAGLAAIGRRPDVQTLELVDAAGTRYHARGDRFGVWAWVEVCPRGQTARGARAAEPGAYAVQARTAVPPPDV